MRSPLRHLEAWIDHFRLRDRCREVEWQLGAVLRHPILLTPTVHSGGYDRIFLVRSRRDPELILACVRMNCPWREFPVAEPNLPRVTLPGFRRIAREAHVYERLASFGISPELIARGTYFLANQYLPWPRLSDVLKREPHRLWQILPAVLQAVRTMHDQGVVHMDLNCGNLLIDPAGDQVAIIDFEFAPAHHLLKFDQQRFDYLRLAHNLLKPRRGREAAIACPDRFVQIFARFAPESGYGLPEPLYGSSFQRVLDDPRIAEGFQDVFGVFEDHPLA